MSKYFIPIIISVFFSTTTLYGLYNYLPLEYLEFGESEKANLGSTITVIQGSDRLTDSRSVINTNFANLNADKIENASSSIAAITTLANLSTVGTIVSGVWNGTAVTAPYGGTGSTTLSSNQVLLGNGTGNIKTVTGWGTSGQLLTSSGGTDAPTWSSASFDVNANYTLGGAWTWNTATSTFNATTSINRILVIGTSTPGIFTGIANAYNMYMVGALGVGVATSSSNGNVRVANYLQVDGQASTTDLVISGACTGCSLSDRYTASSTTFALSSGTQTHPSFSGSKDAYIVFTISNSANIFGSEDAVLLPRNGANSITYTDQSNATGSDGCRYTFAWSGTSVNLTETTQTGVTCSISGNIYWYK